MTRFRQVRSLLEPHAAYIAGLVDGEGSIGLLQKHKRDNRQLVLSISNNELGLLNFVADTVGAGKITRKRSASPRHKASYTYTVTNRQALSLLSQISEYLRNYKLKRAELILEHYEPLTPRNGKYSSVLKVLRDAFVEKCMRINR